MSHQPVIGNEIEEREIDQLTQYICGNAFHDGLITEIDFSGDRLGILVKQHLLVSAEGLPTLNDIGEYFTLHFSGVRQYQLVD